MSDHVCYVCHRADGAPLAEGVVETRPYGVDGQDICFDCMMSDPERQAEANRRIDAKLRGLLEEAGPGGSLILDPDRGFVGAIKGSNA